MSGKHSLPPSVFAIFSVAETIKPPCPCCGAEAKPKRRAVRWAEAYGHRCEHGTPCPAFGYAFGNGCEECAAKRQKNEAQSA